MPKTAFTCITARPTTDVVKTSLLCKYYEQESESSQRILSHKCHIVTNLDMKQQLFFSFWHPLATMHKSICWYVRLAMCLKMSKTNSVKRFSVSWLTCWPYFESPKLGSMGFQLAWPYPQCYGCPSVSLLVHMTVCVPLDESNRISNGLVVCWLVCWFPLCVLVAYTWL